MKTALVFALFGTLSAARAQTDFQNLYEGDGSGVLSAFRGDSILTTIGWGPSVSLLDLEGGVVRTIHKRGGPTEYTSLGAKSRAANEIFFVGGDLETCGWEGAAQPIIGRMDSMGTILSLRRYELAGFCPDFLSPEFEVTPDGSAVVWGRSRFFALKTDSDLGASWAQYFDRHGAFQFFRELPGGDLLAGINMDTAGVVVARLNPDGDFLWCKSYIRPRGIVHDCIIESDTSFLITGYTDSIGPTNAPFPPDYDPKLFLMKLDGAGDVQWCKGYDSGPQWSAASGQRIVKAQAGGYVLMASTYSRVFLMKTEQNGDTLWTRSVGADGYQYKTIDLLALPSGGFACSGGIYGYLPFGLGGGSFFLFKSDPFGHLSCFEHHQPVEVLDLFPTDSSFTLMSQGGVTALPLVVGDSIYDPIGLYNACEVANGVAPLQVQKFKVRPNPNTGRFTLQFESPLAAKSYYSVYDTMGRLLYQRPLPAGATLEEVDLSRFSKGTYLVRLTGPEGVLQERVVVE